MVGKLNLVGKTQSGGKKLNLVEKNSTWWEKNSTWWEKLNLVGKTQPGGK